MGCPHPSRLPAPIRHRETRLAPTTLRYPDPQLIKDAASDSVIWSNDDGSLPVVFWPDSPDWNER
jgi:hypothetical protein